MYYVHGLEELTSLNCPYYPKQSIEVQCNPDQNTNGIFHRTRTNTPKIYMEPQKTPNNHSNLEKEGQSWRNHAT